MDDFVRTVDSTVIVPLSDLFFLLVEYMLWPLIGAVQRAASMECRNV